MVTLQFKRGPEASIPSLSSGEPGVTTDTEKLFVGMPSGNTEMAKQTDLSALSDTVTEINESYISNSQINVSGGVAGLGENGALAIAQGGTGGTTVTQALANLGAQPGFNLLVNSRFKYNGRNQTSYTGGALTVDGWNSASGSATITLPDGVTVANAASISQLVQQDSTLFSKSATFSVEDSTGTVYSVSATMPSSAQNTNSQIASQPTPWGSVALWNSNAGSAFFVIISATSAVILTAAKLEIGSVSTLAADLATAQDETIEQLRLDMYDLDPGRPAWVLTQNENLLDNWYFVGGGSQQGDGQFPINQRGQTIYTGGVHGIDRWKSNRSTTTVTVESNGIQFSDSNTDQGGIRQSLKTDFQNKTVTLSLLVSEVTGGVRVWARNDSNFAKYGTNPIKSPGLVTVTATIPSGYPGNFCFYIDGDVGTFSSVSATILAAKLELGTRSTLARLVDGEWVLNDPPPNFQQELAKCQRMYQIYSSATERPSNGYDCRPVMRLAAPSQGTILINDQTWYYNDANL